jgi:hypothetical protein
MQIILTTAFLNENLCLIFVQIYAVAVAKGKMFSEPQKREYTRISGSVENLYDIDNTGMITGYVGTEIDLVVPETIRGITVRGVAMNAFKDNSKNLAYIVSCFLLIGLFISFILFVGDAFIPYKSYLIPLS